MCLGDGFFAGPLKMVWLCFGISMNEEYLRIGVITSPHGIRGEVNVYPTTDDIRRFSQVKSVTVDRKGSLTRMDITGVKQQKGMIILGLSGITDRTEAEGYRQADILIYKHESPKEEGRYLVCDLIGMRVFTGEGEEVGVINDVLFTGANSIYQVERPGKKELLLPAIPDCIKAVDVENKRMTVEILPGLEDL